MFEYIKGNVAYISPYYVVIETEKIGYQIAVANPFSYSVNEDKEVKVYIHQVIRDDAHLLYGFHTLEEKQLFLKLISVSGIGPKSGMAIMALDDHAGLVSAIEAEDATYLTKFPGVGKKTAQQLILDLKGKLSDVDIDRTKVSNTNVQSSLFSSEKSSHLLEALEALKALGYSERELKRITPGLEKTLGSTTDEYLRAGLKLLMKK